MGDEPSEARTGHVMSELAGTTVASARTLAFGREGRRGELSDRPLWVRSLGAGVHWLHVRRDSDRDTPYKSSG